MSHDAISFVYTETLCLRTTSEPLQSRLTLSNAEVECGHMLLTLTEMLKHNNYKEAKDCFQTSR